MEDGLRRAFAGERRVVELPTLDVDVDGVEAVAINDVVCATSTIGRMVELEWAVGGEDARRAAVRRRDLRDPDRLDRVQPLERRAGARLGARRDGGHVRRRRTRCTRGRWSSRAGAS